jgi:hypothetical protein
MMVEFQLQGDKRRVSDMNFPLGDSFLNSREERSTQVDDVTSKRTANISMRSAKTSTTTSTYSAYS